MQLRQRTRQAKILRQNATEAERRLWYALRGLKLPFNIRRQHPLGRYIADFAIPARKLVIELDGGQHAEAVEADLERTRQIEKRGYRVIRFWNNEVLENLEGVLDVIAAAANAPPPLPGPLRPLRGRRGN